MTPTGAVNRLWRCAVAGGTAGAAAYELFQCLCAQPPSRVGSPGDTYTIYVNLEYRPRSQGTYALGFSGKVAVLIERAVCVTVDFRPLSYKH